VSSAQIEPIQSETREAYRAVRETAGYCPVGKTILALRGRESVEFIDRISTNALRDLTVGHVRPTILLNEKGRFVDCIDVLHLGEEILLVGSGVHRTELKRWVEHYIIMEDISVSDKTDEYSSSCLIGGQAGSGIRIDPASSGTIQGHGTSVHYPSGYWPGTVTFLGRKNRDGTDSPEQSPAWYPTQRVAESMLEIFRIEAGIPFFGTEITGEYNPLEAGMRDFISFTKGCYTGQEVIARIDSYKKLQKQLIGIRPDDPAQELRRSMELSIGGEIAGHITSACWSPGLNSSIALAYRKTSATNGQMTVHDGLTEIPVTITALPFLKM
jgi:folate-binding protein YgfZ